MIVDKFVICLFEDVKVTYFSGGEMGGQYQGPEGGGEEFAEQEEEAGEAGSPREQYRGLGAQATARGYTGPRSEAFVWRPY